MRRQTRDNLKASQWMPKLQRILTNKGLTGLSDPCIGYFIKHKRHLVGGLIVLCLFSLIASSTAIKTSRKISEINPFKETKEYTKWHESIEESPGSDTSSPYGACNIQSPEHPERPMEPILVATFPGGSSDLMRFLIEATTGLWTSSRKLRDDVVAIKTHYPYYENHISPADSIGTPKSLLVLRDPLDSMESWFSWLENTKMEKGLDTKIPEKRWLKWRDDHFQKEIENWQYFIRFWLDDSNNPSDTRFVMIHEELVDETSGPVELFKMVEFFQSVSQIPNLVLKDQIPCIWYRILKGESQQFQQRRLRSSTTEEEVEEVEEVKSERPYTFEQLDLVASLLTQMIDDFSQDGKVLPMLLQYRTSVLEKMARLKRTHPVLVTNSHGSCMVTTPEYEENLTPIFQASYPGSGSGLMRDLIEALTSIKTGETKRRNDVVSVKTLYPSRTLDIAPSFFNRDMKRMILLIRNPLHAIPSHFNHIYWQRNGLPLHTGQPPESEWAAWRDENFMKEMESWVDHFLYWTNKFEPKNRLIINYEDLIREGYGAKQATRLAFFIKGSSSKNTIEPAPSFTIPCLWFRTTMVNNEASQHEFHSGPALSGTKNYIPSFSTRQLEMTVAKLSTLYRQFSYDLYIGPMLQNYYEDAITQMHHDYDYASKH